MTAVMWILSVLAIPAFAMELELSGFRSGKGFAAVSIFAESGREAYPGDSTRAERTLYIALEGRTELKIPLEALPPGNYAVAVLHDEDGDRKLDTVLGVPSEGFGFSNNPTVFFGPPEFLKVMTEFGADSTTQIKLKYFL